MNWKKIKIPVGAKVFYVHEINIIINGINYTTQINEYDSQTFTGHAEDSADRNSVIDSVNGNSLEDCLQALIDKIQQRN